jgi:positive regulator of sigma E activity
MWIEAMERDPSRKADDLQTVIVGGLFVAVVLALSVNMLGGGWLWAAIVFLGVNVCGWLLAKRLDRHYDRIKRSGGGS